MYIFPLLLLILYYRCPESAYWYVQEKKYDRARKSLRTMYGVYDDTVTNGVWG